MNSQWCGSWMCRWVFGSRAPWSTYLRLLKEGEKRVVLWDFVWCFFGWFCVCGVFLCLCGFLFFFLLPAAYYTFCWSHSAVDELSIGWVSEEQILCVFYAQVTAKTAVRGHLSAPLGPFFPLPVVRVICAFTRLQSLAGLAGVQNFLEDKQ